MGHADHALECGRPSHPFGRWLDGSRIGSGHLQNSDRIVPEQCRCTDPALVADGAEMPRPYESIHGGDAHRIGMNGF